MRNKTLAGTFLTFILTCALGAVSSAIQSFASSPRWYVDPRGYPYGDFRTITEAIQSLLVKDGDLIIVNTGTYRERPYVNKSLTILSLYSGGAIVDGSGGGDVFTIAAANVALKDFTIKYSGDNFAAVKMNTVSVGGNISSNVISDCGYGIFLDASDSNFFYNNTISNSKQYGIYIENSSNNNVSANKISATMTFDGLYIKNSSNNIISNNQFSENRHGINLSFSQNNTINSNTLSNDREYGIFLNSSGNNNLSGNTMTNNQYNFGIDGQVLEDFIQTIDSSNKVDTKPIRYLVDKHDENVSGNSGFVALVNSDNMNVTDLTLTKNSYGLLLVNTNYSRIENLDISDNERYGILLRSSHRNEITSSIIRSSKKNDCIHLEASSNNVISENTIGPNSVDGISLHTSSGNEIKNNIIQYINQYSIHIFDSNNNTVDSNNITEYENVGIYLEDSMNNILTNNEIKGQQVKSYSGIYLVNSSYNEINMSTISLGYHYGIDLGDLSSNNRIYHNSFLWNIQHASAMGYSNVWDDGYPSGGNYWSDYTGVDANGDGIGDTSYQINIYNIDNYPLMNSIHDLAVVNITPSKTLIMRGEIVDINVTIENQGVSAETFDVKVYYNITLLDTTRVTLESRNFTTLLFRWNTTYMLAGNYKIKAYATPVKGEIYTDDNTLAFGGIVTIEKSGDINGDGKVNLSDLVRLATKFGAVEGDPNSPPDPPYDPLYDLNKDGKINMSDLVIVASQFGT